MKYSNKYVYLNMVDITYEVYNNIHEELFSR